MKVMPADIRVAGQALLKLAYIEARTPYQRALLGAYSRAVIELARCAIELERAEHPTAATLARYASEVTDIACEHVAMSAEIQQVPQMTERVQVLALQIVGTVVAGCIIAGSAYLATKGYPVPAVLVSSLVSALIAKLFGVPLQAVTLNAVSKMPPPMAAAVAMRAIDSLPPAQREQLSDVAVVLKNVSNPPPPPAASER
jgi:hypothetical protein